MAGKHTTRSGIRRRTVLATIAAGTVAGCLGGDSADVPEPVALDEGQTCDNCGMQIQNHPGPVGQSYYLDDRPDGLPADREDGVAWFCSTVCTYAFRFDAGENGHEPAGSYGTDYSGVEYRLQEEQGATVISAHLGADAFERLADLTLVVDSAVEGAMGGSLVGFGDAADAEAFAGEHGGTLLEDDEVSREVLSTLSGG
jgi:copper chaperone NosL